MLLGVISLDYSVVVRGQNPDSVKDSFTQTPFVSSRFLVFWNLKDAPNIPEIFALRIFKTLIFRIIQKLSSI